MCHDLPNSFARKINRNAGIETRCLLGNPLEMANAKLSTRSKYNKETLSHMACSAIQTATKRIISLEKLDAIIAVYSSGFLQPGLAEILGDVFKEDIQFLVEI
jgi:predicted naringenin-chalcone synthase